MIPDTRKCPRDTCGQENRIGAKYCSLCGAAIEIRQGSAFSAASGENPWILLRKGMDYASVTKLLGQPIQTKAGYLETTWTYRAGGKYGTGGKVVFNNQDRVQEWDPPSM